MKEQIEISNVFALSHIMEVSQSPFGNYAVQEIMSRFPLEITKGILEKLRGKLSVLSQMKFSANVIEKALEISDVTMKNQFVQELSEKSKLLGTFYIFKKSKRCYEERIWNVRANKSSKSV